MDSKTPQTPYDLDTRLLTINKLAKTAQARGRWLDADRLFELAFKLLGYVANAKPEASPESKSEPPEVKEEPTKSKVLWNCGLPDCRICFPSIFETMRIELKDVELPKVCADPGCGICHPWNKEVE